MFKICILALFALTLNINAAHAPFSSIYTSTILSHRVDANSTGTLPSISTSTAEASGVTSTYKGPVTPQQQHQQQQTTQKRLMVVSFVNGIYHTEDEWRNLTQSLSEVFSSQVRAFYNPSSGTAFFNWVQDAAKAGYELMRRPNDLDLAKRLAEHLRNILEEVGPTGRVLHLAHSGGAILTYLAAKYHLTTQETDRIDLATFGGGRSITRKYFKGRIVNYYSRNDPLTLVDGRAGALMKHAVGHGKGGGSANTSYWEVRDRKHNTTFVYLHGLADNPLIDHSMFGPTYERALNIEAANFKQRLSMMTAAVIIAEANWMRKVRKSAAKMTGMRHFWGDTASTVQSTVRVVRKRAAKLTKQHGYFSKKTTLLSNLTAMVGKKGAILSNSSGVSSIGWRSSLMHKAASSLGRYYPSALLPAVSSSEAWLDHDHEAEAKLRASSASSSFAQSSAESLTRGSGSTTMTSPPSHPFPTIFKGYQESLRRGLVETKAAANRLYQTQRGRYESMRSSWRTYWSMGRGSGGNATAPLRSPAEDADGDIEAIQVMEEKDDVLEYNLPPIPARGGSEGDHNPRAHDGESQVPVLVPAALPSFPLAPVLAVQPEAGSEMPGFKAAPVDPPTPPESEEGGSLRNVGSEAEAEAKIGGGGDVKERDAERGGEGEGGGKSESSLAADK